MLKELLLSRKRCATELQKLWQDLDLREKAFEEAAQEAGSKLSVWKFASGNSTGTMTLLDIVGLQTVYI